MARGLGRAEGGELMVRGLRRTEGDYVSNGYNPEDAEESPTPFHYGPPRREAPAYTTWTQKDGTPIQIRHMDDRHLFNAIRMLERIAKKEGLGGLAVENFLPPIYGKLVKAAEARGIDLDYQEPEEERLAALDRWNQLQKNRRLAREV